MPTNRTAPHLTDETAEDEAEARAHLRSTLARVMMMQVFALGVLWLLQMRYAS